MATTLRPATEEDSLRAPKDGLKYELVDGEIRVSPGGTRHGEVSARFLARLMLFVEGTALAMSSSPAPGSGWW